ncbi:sensor histidine kinase [Oceanobacillus massiliensis]|nr:sensor histidine kinase [Oceanobacillus massiliensis]
MKRFLNVSLKVKILGLIISLIILIIGLMTITLTTLEYREEIRRAEHSALQTARMISYMPHIQEAIKSESLSHEGRLTITQLIEETGAAGIVLESENAVLYSTVPSKIRKVIAEDNLTYRALVFASAYVEKVTLDHHKSLLGIAPVSIDNGPYYQIEGTVTVRFDENLIIQNIFKDINKILVAAFIVLVIGIIGGVILTKSIRKDTLGLEPIEIASLYKQRNAILQSVKEGIIAVDSNEKIAMMNHSAKNILHVKGKVKGIQLDKIFYRSQIIDMINSPIQTNDAEIEHNGRTIIVNTMPILEENKRIGTVASFRDKTEIQNMVNTISEVKQYSEDLRAQNHEFTNKLYVLLGLLQLGKTEEAMEFIQEITKIQELNADIIFNYIHDEKVQAILLGKLAKASENKLEFTIDQNSSLEKLPSRFALLPLLIIISNLIDNAFEAAANKEEGKVTFFTTDIGKEVIFEISDNGNGINEEILPDLFSKGASGKGADRGYGLSNVKYEVEELDGSIEFETSAEGTIFTVFLPKQ